MADKKQNRKNNRSNDEDYNPKFRRTRKKVCALCANKDLVLDYKNADQLKKFINEKGKILPRRVTGTCAKHQRYVAMQIKRARMMAILPFTK